MRGWIRKTSDVLWKEIRAVSDSISGRGLQMGERLGETGVGEVVAQSRIGGTLMSGGPCENLLRDGFQRVEMARGVAVAPAVVGDDGFTAAEELDQFGVHGTQAMKHPDS